LERREAVELKCRKELSLVRYPGERRQLNEEAPWTDLPVLQISKFYRERVAIMCQRKLIILFALL
jgi:hypothetical protein